MKKIPKIKILLELITYAVIGTVNFLLDMTVVNILMFVFHTYRGHKLIYFSIISFFVYSINGYIMNKKYTFKSNDSTYFKYVSVLGISMLLDSIIFSILSIHNVFNLNQILWANISKLIAFSTTGTLCFIANKLLVFKRK